MFRNFYGSWSVRELLKKCTWREKLDQSTSFKMETLKAVSLDRFNDAKVFLIIYKAQKTIHILKRSVLATGRVSIINIWFASQPATVCQQGRGYCDLIWRFSNIWATFFGHSATFWGTFWYIKKCTLTWIILKFDIVE